jgi:hypothetical protein
VGVDGDLGARRRENKGNLKKYYSIKMRERIT